MTIKRDENNNPMASLVGDSGVGCQAYLNLSNLLASEGRDWRPNGDRELSVEALDEF